MTRDGPGFIEDLVLLWITLGVWIIISEVVITSLGISGIVATGVGIVVGVIVAFVMLYGYYRIYLEEKPLQST